MDSGCVVERRAVGAAMGIGLALAIAWAPAGAADWRRAEVPATRGVLRAVAAGAGARLALADARGVWLRDPAGRFQHAALSAPVNDLAFDRAGGLWIASDRGLLHWQPPGGPEERSPAPGPAARRALRVAADALVAVATEDGAYVSADGRAWTHVDAGLPSGPVAALAFERTGRSGEARALWIALPDEVWEVGLGARAGGLAIGPAHQRHASVGLGLVEVAIDAEGVLLVGRSRLEWLRAQEADWRSVRPAWPPGATPRRALRAGGRLWLATDRGVLWAPELAGPWRRAGTPAGGADAWALARDAERLFAATDAGLLEAPLDDLEAPLDELAGPAPAGSAARSDAGLPASPEPEALRLAVLRHLDLGPLRLRRLQEGVARRGWLPDLELRLAADRSRQRQHDLDEAFLSGATRRLYDLERSRERELAASITLRWDLGDTAYHPESIDVSRESREVIELRDDILDEVNQLYFERERALLELAQRPPDPLETARLRLRVRELTAGLDAWSGGWFSRRLARHPSTHHPVVQGLRGPGRE